MKSDLNYAALEERLRKAVRWESIRAAYFERINKKDNALLCRELVRFHLEDLDDLIAGNKRRVRHASSSFSKMQ